MLDIEKSIASSQNKATPLICFWIVETNSKAESLLPLTSGRETGDSEKFRLEDQKYRNSGRLAHALTDKQVAQSSPALVFYFRPFPLFLKLIKI